MPNVTQVFNARDALLEAAEKLKESAEEISLSEDDIMDTPASYTPVVRKMKSLTKKIEAIRAQFEGLGSYA